MNCENRGKRLSCHILLILLGILLFSRISYAGTEAEITVLAPKVEQQGFNGELISEKVDEYVYPLIGGHVRIMFVEFERYSQIVSRYEMTSSLPDVLFLWSDGDASRLTEKGMLAPLENLLEQYGEPLLNAVGEETIAASIQNGHLYTIPTLHDRASSTGFEYRKEIADKYDLDMESVHSIEDLSCIFEELHEKAPDLIPCDMIFLEHYDTLGDSLGVLMDYGQSAEVVNLYETPEYEQFMLYIREWRKKGYLLDMDLGFDSSNRYVASPEIFGKFAGYHPALTYVDSVDAGEEICCVPLTEAFVTTDSMRGLTYSISERSQEKELAVRFLNLLYTDARLINLLTYGLEGVHYQVLDQEAGVIGFPDGINRQNSGYYQFRGYFWGNEFLSYLWEGYPEDLWQQVQDFNDTAQRSAAFGFSYDPTPVAEQAQECLRIADIYLPLLENGFGDTETLLTEFQEALQLAGIDAVIKEKQKQLNDFLEEKEAP